MPSAYALGIVSRNSILDFGVAERLRAFRYSFFTGGVVMENGRCSAASYGSATLRTFPTIAARNKKAIVFASLHQRWLRIGAADEARTRYLHLGKVALYQMSYGRILETLLGLLTGASDRNRTNDTGIFSPLLYRLSYRGKYDPDRARTDDPQRDRLVL